MQQKWLILSAVAFGTFMATLDASIVNVALPSITSFFQTGISTSRWVIISYLFSITGLLLFFGRIADLVGRKTIFTLGFMVFTFGSLLCGLAGTIHSLILARGFQGFGAAMMMANGPAVITATFPSSERGKALGTLAMVVSAGLAIGPTLGGLMVKSLSWPSIFYVNIPFGIIGTFLAYRSIPASIGMNLDAPVLFSNMTPQEAFDRERRLPLIVRIQLIINRMKDFDWLGALFWMLIQLGYSIAIDRDNALGLNTAVQSLLMFTTGAIAIMFIIWELGIKSPILDFNLFRSRVFLASNISSLFNFIATSSVTILLPFYFQNVRGLGPDRVGMIMSSLPITIFFVAPVSGRLSDRYGSRFLSTLGMGLMCLALALMALPHSGLASEDAHKMTIYLILIGMGIGLFQSPNNNAIMGSVERHQLGVASALLATMRNFGLVTGTALCTTLFMHFYNVKLVEYAGMATAAENFVSSLRHTFLAISIFCSVGIFTSFIKGERR